MKIEGKSEILQIFILTPKEQNYQNTLSRSLKTFMSV